MNLIQQCQDNNTVNCLRITMLLTSAQNRVQYYQQQHGQGPIFQVFYPNQVQWPRINKKASRKRNLTKL